MKTNFWSSWELPFYTGFTVYWAVFAWIYCVYKKTSPIECIIYRVIRHFRLFGNFSISAGSIRFRGTVSREDIFNCFPVTCRAEHWWRQTYYLAASRRILDLILYVPVNIFQLWRDWTSNAQIRNTRAFYQWATALSTLYICMRCGFVARQKNSPNLFDFGFQIVPLNLTKKPRTYILCLWPQTTKLLGVERAHPPWSSVENEPFARLLLPFVSSELGNKTTNSYLSVQQSNVSHPRCCGWPDALLPSAFGLVQQQCHRVIHSTFRW